MLIAESKAYYMDKKEEKTLEYTVLALVIIFILAAFAFIKNNDINYCRSVFAGLIKGSYSIQKYIDWENLTAMGADAGAVYSKLSGEKAQIEYKKAFVEGFTRGFKQQGGELKLFTNWRIYDKDIESIIVAADYKKYNKTILFTLSKYAKKKIVKIEWEQ